MSKEHVVNVTACFFSGMEQFHRAMGFTKAKEDLKLNDHLLIIKHWRTVKKKESALCSD